MRSLIIAILLFASPSISWACSLDYDRLLVHNQKAIDAWKHDQRWTVRKESVRSMKLLQAYFVCLTETSQDAVQKADAEFMLNLANELIDFESNMLVINLGGALGAASDLTDEDATWMETFLSLGFRGIEALQFEKQKEAEWEQFVEKSINFSREMIARRKSFDFDAG